MLDKRTVLRFCHRLEKHKLADVTDVTEGNALLHGQETDVSADVRYLGADKRPGADPSVRWQVAIRHGKRKKLDKATIFIIGNQSAPKNKCLSVSVKRHVIHCKRVVVKTHLGGFRDEVNLTCRPNRKRDRSGGRL